MSEKSDEGVQEATVLQKQSLINLLGVFIEAKRAELEEYDLRPDALETQFSKFWHGQIDEAELLMKSEGAQEAMSADKWLDTQYTPLGAFREQTVALLKAYAAREVDSAIKWWAEEVCDMHDDLAKLEAENTHLRAAVPKWISVKDQMPEYDVDVIVWNREWPRVHFGYWRHSEEWIGRSRAESDEPLPKAAPTHWQPLPEPPEVHAEVTYDPRTESLTVKCSPKTPQEPKP